MEEGWKLIGTDKTTGNLRSGTNKMRKPPKDSTINREVTMIQEWFKYLLVPEGLVQVAPVIQKQRHKRQTTAPTHHLLQATTPRYQRRFRKWANEPKSNLNQKPEWRQVVYLFFLLSANIGWRPDSEGLELTWDCVKVRHRRRNLSNGEHKDEVISNLENMGQEEQAMA